MKITIPTNRNWVISYFGDLFANIIDAFNIDLHYSQGKIRTGQYLYPHTVTDDIPAIKQATAFVLSNADNSAGTLKYWAACEALYKQQNIFTTIFAADALTDSPTDLIDSDLVKFGVTQGSLTAALNGIDILVLSEDTDLSLLNRLAAGAFAWIQNWWTSDLTDTIISTNSSAPIQVQVASSAAYHNGDQIEISGSGTKYASYTGNGVTTNSGTNLQKSTITGLLQSETQTMAVGSPISGTNIPANTFITSVTQATTSVSTDGSCTISNLVTGTGTVSLTWSDMVPHTIDGLWNITVADGTHINLIGSSGLNSFGNATNISFTGDITRIFNSSTSVSYLGQNDLISGVPHILLPFGNGPVLFVTDDYQVHSIGTPGNASTPTSPSDVSYARLVFRNGYSCKWVVATSLKIYFGLSDKRSNSYPSLVEEYDPFNEQVRETVVQNGATIGFINGNVLNIIDIKGNLKSYNGSDFDVYAQLPTTEIDGNSITLPHRNGIFVSENRINVLIPGNSYFYGGWWTYEIDTKRLYHQGSPVTSKVSQSSFGSSFGDSYGAFFLTSGLGIALAGASVAKTASLSLQSGIFLTENFSIGGTPGYNPIGRITLGKIPSSEIDSVFRNVLLKYNSVLDRVGQQSGTIVLKYKVAEYPKNGYSISGTWVDATHFTIPTSQSLRLIVGAEMIIIEGQAAGASAHIVSLSAPSGGNVTVTITNESFGFVPSGAFTFNMDNFFRLFQNDGGDITDNTKNYGIVDLPENAINEWVELRIELRGFFSLEEVQIGSQQNLMIEPSDTSAAGQYYAPKYNEKGQLS